MTAYYVATGNPPAATRGLSAQLRAEFTLIVDAFNAAQADIALRATLASPTFTGIPTAPTAAVGTSTTQIATTAFVAATSLSAALPGQGGNAGKVITTDGTTASWGSSLKASVIRVADGTDATKLMAFDVSAYTAGTTRTVALPDKSGTLLMNSDVATQAQMEAASSTTVFASPGNVNWHPGVAKAWIKCDAAGAISASHNITSITDDGTGLVTVTIATDFSSANYAICATGIYASGTTIVQVKTQTGGTFQLQSVNPGVGVADPDGYCAACFGDQA